MGLLLRDGKPPQRPSLRLSRSALEYSLQSVPPVSLNPMVSPALEEVPVWNILPSYQLFELTFSKNIVPTRDRDLGEPPEYQGDYFLHAGTPPYGYSEALSPGEPRRDEASGTSSELTLASLREPPEGFTHRRHHSEIEMPTHTRYPEAFNSNRWENTILANTHRLKRLESLDKPLADHVRLEIFFTTEPASQNKKSTIYDPTQIEFAQGDAVYGYVTVLNTFQKPLSFDMFSVVLEGRITINNLESDVHLPPAVFHKFLNMFDFNASWTPAYFNESSNAPASAIDPLDGTSLYLPIDMCLEPGVTYKKFFHFTIPEKLLDCACETHSLPAHCQLLPTLGLDKSVFLQRLRKLREAPVKTTNAKGKPASFSASKKANPAAKMLATDFCFPDTSVSYTVEARVVGNALDYIPGPQKDEYIIVKELSTSLRIIPRVKNTDYSAGSSISQYASFTKEIQRALDLGRRLDKGEQDVARKSSTAKRLYGNLPDPTPTTSNYEVILPFRKKQLTQPSKVVGVLRACVPKRQHSIRYVVPSTFVSFRNKTPLSPTDTIIETPIELYFKGLELNKGSRPPEIRGVGASLVAYTLRSKKYPIPVELSQDMMFDEAPSADNDIERHVVARYSGFLQELSALASKHGIHVLGVTRQTVMDIKSLAKLQVKSNTLKLEHVQLETKGGLSGWTEKDGEFYKKLDVSVNIGHLFEKNKSSLEDFQGALSLVPSFQSCIICRYYCLALDIKLGNGDMLSMKLPVVIYN